MNVLIFIGLLVGLFVARWLIVVMINWYQSINEFYFNSDAGYFTTKLVIFLLILTCFLGTYIFSSFILSWGLNFLLGYKISIIKSIGLVVLLRSVLFISKTSGKE